MKPEKLKKIRAILNNPASTENEKEICRKLLAKHPEADGQFHVFDNAKGSPFSPIEPLEDIFRRQAAQAQRSAFYNQHTGQAANRQAAAQRDAQAAQAAQARQTGQGQQFGGGFGNHDPFSGVLGGAFGAGGQAQTPKADYSQADFERAQANIEGQRRAQENSVAKILKKSFLKNLAAVLRGKPK